MLELINCEELERIIKREIRDYLTEKEGGYIKGEIGRYFATLNNQIESQRKYYESALRAVYVDLHKFMNVAESTRIELEDIKSKINETHA